MIRESLLVGAIVGFLLFVGPCSSAGCAAEKTCSEACSDECPAGGPEESKCILRCRIGRIAKGEKCDEMTEPGPEGDT